MNRSSIKTFPTMPQETKHIRMLRVYSKARNCNRNQTSYVPELRLLGEWLKEAGFEIDGTVSVTVKQKELTIKAVS